MKVLALISGGKDSIFNIAKCIEQDHEIIALGNMYNEGIKLVDNFLIEEGQEGK